MKWKIIFFDLDGTLVDHNFFLSPEIINAVKKIHNLGLRVSVATGRSQDSAKKFLDLLQIREKVVVHNGSVVLNCDKTFKVLRTIEDKLIKELIQFHQKQDISFKLHFADSRIIKSNFKKWPGEGQHFVEGEVVQNLENLDFSGVVKIVFFESDEKIQQLKNNLPRDLKVRFLRTHLKHIEILHSNISKSTGILYIAKENNLEPSEIIAVGDQENDYEMIRDAGLGITVGEVNEKLATVSDLNFPPLFNGGITQLVHFLEKNVF